MPNDKHLPLCPYYKRNMVRSISCEDINRTFADSQKKEQWMKMYCDTSRWSECRFAKDRTEAYERLFKGDEKAIMENDIKSLEREVKKLSTLLGRAEKRVERQQKKIDELRMVNQSFVNRNETLERINREAFIKWRDVNALLESYEERIAAQVQVIADAYEARLAYLIDKHGTFSDIDVDEWRKGKSFALVYDKDDDGYPCWNLIFKTDEDGEQDGHEDTDIQEQKPE